MSEPEKIKEKTFISLEDAYKYYATFSIKSELCRLLDISEYKVNQL